MRLRKSTVYPLVALIIVATLILILNSDYFFYLSDKGQKFSPKFNIISGFVGNDSRFYYNMDDDLLYIIYSGFIAGGVFFGSILSLIGIFLYVEMAELFFGNKVLGVFLLNIILFSLIMKTFQFKTYSSSLSIIFLFPLTLNYILVPNKEIFGLLVLAFLSAEKTPFRWLVLLLISLARDSYIAQIIFFIGAKYVNIRLLYLSFFAITPFIIPESYFSDSTLISGQRSGYITSVANSFLQIPLLSFIGILIKIIIGLFSPLVIPFDELSILKIQHFLCSVINLTFFVKLYLSRSFRDLIFKDSPNYLRACLIYASFMALAPGNPARFLAPLTFMFLFKLLCRK